MRLLLVFFFLGQALLFGMSDKALGITIDLAGKQRMLTQRIAKESLLVLLRHQPDSNRQKLHNDIALFDKTLKGLIHGDTSLGLEPVDDPKIQAQLQKITTLFAPFKQSAEAIVQGSTKYSDYRGVILKKNIELLEEMNRAVYMYAALSNDPANQGLKMANNINLAGKQRMLTQRMAKDLLLLYAVDSPKQKAHYLRDFHDAKALFGKTIRGLIDGDSELNLVKTTLPDIRNQLLKVAKLWQESQPTFKRAMREKKALYRAVTSLDRLMAEMNHAVKLYTRSIDRQKLRNQLSSIVSDFFEKKNSLRKLVNISGKQRMLTQRISKLALQCALGLKRQESCQAMQRYKDMYAHAIVLFIKGDPKEGIDPTKSRKILRQIKQIYTQWKPFAEQVDALAKSHGRNNKALLYILRHEQALLQASDKLVKLYEQSDRSHNPIEKARLHIVNIAGRQRMLTQKMTKEKLLWQMLKSEKQKAKMEETIALFEKSLRGLVAGDGTMGLPKVTNPKIKAQLKKVESLWRELKPLYLKAGLSTSELNTLIEKNPVLLAKMHRAVGMIEEETEY